MSPSMRAGFLLALAGTTIAGFYSSSCGIGAPARLSNLAWVATAHQRGCVSYRDSPGTLSADGAFIAYAEGRFVRIKPTWGGPTEPIPPTEHHIHAISWHPHGSRLLVELARRPRRWWIVDRRARTTTPLWEADTPIVGEEEKTKEKLTTKPNEIWFLSWSPDGNALAGVVPRAQGAELWRFSHDLGHNVVQRIDGRPSALAWTPLGQLACIVLEGKRRRLAVPCTSASIITTPDVDLYGPMAFSPDGGTAYAGAPNSGGTLDLWGVELGRKAAARITSFSRDTYGPSVAKDGSLLFRLAAYRTTVAMVAADGGPTSPQSTFQSETPSWDPPGKRLAITYGTWRRVIDDVNYPDIDQRIGMIPADGPPADKPSEVLPHFDSEDQSGCWSPNSKWFVFHSHRLGSDDLWIRPADGKKPDQRITFFGRGAETGWPRWSADGLWVTFNSHSHASGRHAAYVMGIDQESGSTTTKAKEIEVTGVTGDLTHGEWLPDNATIVGHVHEVPGRQAIVTFSREGGPAKVVHQYACEHYFPGLAVSPDGADVAFVAAASDGVHQIWRMPLAGGTPRQLTADPTEKSQPAWSPDGRRIALTIWDYQSQFWLSRP